MVVAMDRFTRCMNATDQGLLLAIPVLYTLHVVSFVGEGFGRPGQEEDPLKEARRTVHTVEGLRTARQRTRVQDLFSNERYTGVEANRGICQRVVTAYREPDGKFEKFLMLTPIGSLTAGRTTRLGKLHPFSRTLKQCTAEDLAYRPNR